MEFYNMFQFENSGLPKLNTSKYIAIFVFVINVLFFIIGFFNDSFFVFLIPAFLIFIVLLWAHFFYTGRYGRLISIENNRIKVFKANKKLLRELYLSDIKTIKKVVEIRPQGRGVPALLKECLIMYKGIELDDYIEYVYYMNNPNVLIIQNPETIEKIEKVLSYNIIG